MPQWHPPPARPADPSPGGLAEGGNPGTHLQSDCGDPEDFPPEATGSEPRAAGAHTGPREKYHQSEPEAAGHSSRTGAVKEREEGFKASTCVQLCQLPGHLQPPQTYSVADIGPGCLDALRSLRTQSAFIQSHLFLTSGVLSLLTGRETGWPLRGHGSLGGVQLNGPLAASPENCSVPLGHGVGEVGGVGHLILAVTVLWGCHYLL